MKITSFHIFLQPGFRNKATYVLHPGMINLYHLITKPKLECIVIISIADSIPIRVTIVFIILIFWDNVIQKCFVIVIHHYIERYYRINQIQSYQLLKTCNHYLIALQTSNKLIISSTVHNNIFITYFLFIRTKNVSVHFSQALVWR